MFNWYKVINRDGSTVEVIAESYKFKAEPGVGVLLVFEPDKEYRDDQAGTFLDPQGVARLERDVVLPDAGASNDG